MTYLLSQYWIFIALAFVLGLFVGRATCGEGEDRGGGWLGWAIAGFLGALFLALFRIVPGFAGHLLEVALLLSGAYLIGCVAGCGGRWSSDGAGASATHDDHGAHAPSETVGQPPAVSHAEIFGQDTSASYPGKRPAALATPRGGSADDLGAIAGMDAGTVKALGDIGVYHHDQIAAWGEPQRQWVEHHLAQVGRIARENWVGQATKLAARSGAAPQAAVAASPAAAGASGTADQAAGAADKAATLASDETADLATRIENSDATPSRLI